MLIEQQERQLRLVRLPTQPAPGVKCLPRVGYVFGHRTHKAATILLNQVRQAEPELVESEELGLLEEPERAIALFLSF